MNKVIVFNRITLDGYFSGLNGELDWSIHDPQVDALAHEMMHADTLLMGRTTYQMFASYWPTVENDPDADAHSREQAAELTAMKKIVFSTTLESVQWKNTFLYSNGLLNVTERLKKEIGSDITIFGSGSIIRQLSAANLINEYLLIISPVVLGSGKSFFNKANPMNLALQTSRSFPSGNIIAKYIVK